MNKRFSNKLLMFWAVLEVLTKFKALWELNKGFVKVRDKFFAAISPLQGISKASAAKTGEITSGKAKSVNFFVVAVFKLSSVLSAYASSIGNADLKSKVDYTESELEEMRPDLLLGTSMDIVGLAKKYATELADLGLTDADVAAVEAYTKDFPTTTTAPRTAITTRKTAGGFVRPQFAVASEILKQEMDNLMEIFRASEPSFYSEYWNARNTPDLGIRHEAKKKNAAKKDVKKDEVKSNEAKSNEVKSDEVKKNDVKNNEAKNDTESGKA